MILNRLSNLEASKSQPRDLAHIAIAVIFLVALLPRVAIALQPIPLQLDKMLPDDAYYYFLTAENVLASGHPSVDGINVSNGWHPLWMLINIGVFALPSADPNFPVYLILLLGAVLDSFVAVILFWNINRYIGLSAALIGAGLYAINSMPIFQSINGLETALAALMLAFAWTTSLRLTENPSRKWAVLWGLTFGLTFLARTDMAVILVGLGLYVLLRLKGSARWVFTLTGAVVAGVVVSPWLIWNQINFDSAFLQVSSVAVPWAVQTRFQTANPGEPLWKLSLQVISGVQFWLRGDYLGAPLFMGFLLWPLGLFGLWKGWHAASVKPLAHIGGLLLVGGVGLLFIHTAIRWYPRPWYFVVMAQALSVGVALAWYHLSSPRLKTTLLAVSTLGTVLFGVIAWQTGYYPWQRSQMYGAALWVKDYAPQDTIVASMNSGIIGYYSDRTTINLDGVVNPQAFAASQQFSLMQYMVDSGVDYFLDFDHALQNEYGPFMGPNFQDSLSEVTQIGNEYPGLGEYHIYRLSTASSD